MYFIALHGPLLRTLLHITSGPFVGPSGSQPQPQVLISYKVRSYPKELPFWAAFGLWFSFAPVLCRRESQGPWERFSLSAVLEPADEESEADGWDQVFVFSATRRPESKGWDIPSSDEALLAGEGARGNRARKSDETFEEILLMGLDLD